MPKMNLVPLVTMGSDLRPSLSRDIKLITLNAEYHATPIQASTVAATAVNPCLSPKTVHSINFRKMIGIRPAYDVKGHAVTEITFGDLFPSARHEVYYANGDFANKPLAFSSSIPTHYMGAGKDDVPSRMITHLSVDRLPLDERKKMLAQILERVETFARQKGEKFLISFANANQASFYKKLGFTTICNEAPFRFVKALSLIAMPILAITSFFSNKNSSI